MERRLKKEHSIAVKKRLDHLRAAPNFFTFLNLRLGQPHRLEHDLKDCYAVNISANYRLIIEPVTEAFDNDSLLNCNTVIIKGVMDYHGGKCNWIIP